MCTQRQEYFRSSVETTIALSTGNVEKFLLPYFSVLRKHVHCCTNAACETHSRRTKSLNPIPVSI